VRKAITGALVGAVCLSVSAVALAETADQTTNNLTIGVSPTKAGTKKKPKAVAYNLQIAGGTKNGGKQPGVSTSLNTILPKDFKINSKIWPKKLRCNLATMRAQKSPNSCPKGSKVGSGISIAKANGGAFTETLKVSAYALTNGNVGFYLLGKPVPLNATLEGKVVNNAHQLNVVIPKEVGEPAPGFLTGITKLQVKFNAKAKTSKRTIGAVETTGCTGGKWKFTFENIIRGGGKVKATDTVSCKK
jgi:hypothetical protein